MSRPARKPRGYQNRVANPARAERRWTAVVVPSPLFASAAEKFRVEAALQDNPRLPGESLADRMERIGKLAGLVPSEAGEDD